MPWRLEKERSMCIYIYTYKYYNMAGSERREFANDASEASPPEERSEPVKSASEASPSKVRAKKGRQSANEVTPREANRI